MASVTRPVASSGTTDLANDCTAMPFSSVGRARSTVPCRLARRPMSRRSETAASAPASLPTTTIRPRDARARKSRPRFGAPMSSSTTLAPPRAARRSAPVSPAAALGEAEHPVAGLAAERARPHRGPLPGDLEARDVRGRAGRRRVVAHPLGHVGPVDAGEAGGDEDLVGRGDRVAALLQPDDLVAPVPGEYDGAHGWPPPALP